MTGTTGLTTACTTGSTTIAGLGDDAGSNSFEDGGLNPTSSCFPIAFLIGERILPMVIHKYNKTTFRPPNSLYAVYYYSLNHRICKE